jgi:photosystem II stability/assembly factor-like uncharacterized protein
MNFVRKSIGCVLVAGAVFSSAGHAEFRGPLDSPALMTHLATKRALNSVVSTSSRLIAVGQRGHIVYSDDAGTTWKQAAVPVRSDLTAVFFSSDRSGWAVGHEGVVLHTEDGGQSWTLQLDGNRAAELVKTYYGDKAREGDRQAESLLPEIERNFTGEADKPFLDVWFSSDSEGFIVGAFGMIFHTRDGGRSWEPWLERIDNPKYLHIYSIRGHGGRAYAVGEQGLFTVLEPGGQRFQAVASPYSGSFFGVLPIDGGALAFGMRGNVYHVQNGPVSWHKLETGVVGGLTAAASLGGDRVALVSAAGDVLVGRATAGQFERLKTQPMGFAGVAFVPLTKSLALVGNKGTAIAPLAQQ